MSKTASPFRDLVKANDLTTKNFFANNSFVVSTETKSGDYTFKSSVSGDAKKPVSALLEPKYEWKEHNLVFEGKFSTANAVTAKATFKNLVPGLSAHLQGDRSVSTVKKGEETVVNVAQSATAGVTYANEKVHFTTEAKVVVPTAKVALTGSLHAKPVDHVSVGLKADWDGEKPKAEAKLIGGTDQLEGALSLTYPENVLGFGFWHSHNAKHQWAATVSHPPVVDGKANTAVTLASNYKFDDFTTLKAKLAASVDRSEKAEHVFRAGVSVQQKVNDNVTVSVGTDVNLNAAWGLGKGGADSSYGVQVAFK